MTNLKVGQKVAYLGRSSRFMKRGQMCIVKYVIGPTVIISGSAGSKVLGHPDEVEPILVPVREITIARGLSGSSFEHGPSQIAPEENTYNDTHDCARCRFLRATCKLHEEITKERS